MATHWRRRSFHPGCCIATVFLLDIIDSKSLHGPVRELHQDNKISNQIILLIRAASVYDYNMPGPIRPLTTFPAMISRASPLLFPIGSELHLLHHIFSPALRCPLYLAHRHVFSPIR
jgi:hypothetical protein